MEKEQYEKFLEDNPVLYDFEKKDGGKEIVNNFFDRFMKVNNIVTSIPPSIKYLSMDEFASIFRGPRTITSSGYECYVNMQDIVSLAFNLYSRLSEEKRKKAMNSLVSNILSISPFFQSTKTIYDSLIKAMYTYHKSSDYVDLGSILNILSGARSPLVEQDNSMEVLCTFYNITSIGKLLNHDIGRNYRTKIILAEIQKGLREDKEGGIPVEDIIEFFTDKKSAKIIAKNFDIESLIMDLYNILYKVGNIDNFMEDMSRNLDLRYNIMTGKTDCIQPPGDNRAVIEQHRIHYINMQKIFDSLLDIAVNNLLTKDYTIAYLIVNAPPESFFIRSSYDKLIESYRKGVTYKEPSAEPIDCGSSDFIDVLVEAVSNKDDGGGYYKIENKTIFDYSYRRINDAILLSPNITIPEDISINLFSASEEWKKYFVDGLQLGFLRHALYITDKVADLVMERFGTGYLNSEQKIDIDYLNMNYIERIHYLLSDEVSNPVIESSEAPGEEEKSPEEEETPIDTMSIPLAIFNSVIYKEGNLSKIMEQTNRLIRSIM
jgi:hypothetical protein